MYFLIENTKYINKMKLINKYIKENWIIPNSFTIAIYNPNNNNNIFAIFPMLKYTGFSIAWNNESKTPFIEPMNIELKIIYAIITIFSLYLKIFKYTLRIPKASNPKAILIKNEFPIILAILDLSLATSLMINKLVPKSIRIDNNDVIARAKESIPKSLAPKYLAAYAK